MASTSQSQIVEEIAHEGERASLVEQPDLGPQRNNLSLLTEEDKYDLFLKARADKLRNITFADTLPMPRDIYRIPENEIYIQSCEQLGIVPVREYLENFRGKVLNLRLRRIGPVGMKALCRSMMLNGTITELNLEGNDIGEGMKYMSIMLNVNSIITNLNIANNKIGAQGVKYVYEILIGCDSLRYLNLAGSDFQDSQGKKFAAAIEKNKGLIELNLSNNSFSDFAGKMIGAALSKNSILEKLDLSWNKLFLQGATGIFNGLKINSTLKELNLSWNGLDDESARYVAAALRANSTLQLFDISYNNLTNEGALGISRGLKMNDTLRKFRLAGNPLRAPGATLILKAINRPNNQMEFLDLTDIRVSREFLKTLKTMKETRDIKVLFGRTVRKNIFPKMLLSAKVVDVRNQHPLEIIEKFTEDKGVNLQKILEERLLPTAHVTPTVKIQRIPAQDVEKDFRLTKEDFVLLFTSPPIGIDEVLVDELLPYVMDSDEKVDLSKLICELTSRQDDIEDDPASVPKKVEIKQKAKRKK